MEVIFYVKVKKENRHSAIPVPLRKLLIFNCVCWPVESYDFYNSNEAQPSLCSYTEDMDCRNTDIYIKEQIVKTIHSNDAANSFDEILHNTYHSSAGDTLLEIDDLFGCSIKITSANQILNTATGEDYIQFISEDRTELSFSKDGEIRKISTLHSPSLAIQSNNFTSQDLQQYCVNKMDKLYQLLNIEDTV